MHNRCETFRLNQNGNSLLMVLTMIMGVGLVAAGGASLAINLFKSTQRATAIQNINGLINVIESVASDPATCGDDQFEGIPGKWGIQFKAANGNSYNRGKYNPTLANSDTGQQVSLRVNIKDAAGNNYRIQRNTQIPELDLKIESFAVARATPKPGDPNVRVAELVISGSQISTGVSIAPRSVGNINLTFTNPADGTTFQGCFV